ncbi:MAG: hypothetical protein Q9177_003228, partial [Variospora cf. flavescens]
GKTKTHTAAAAAANEEEAGLGGDEKNASLLFVGTATVILDHFDRKVEESLRRDLPIITTPHAKEHLAGKGQGEAFTAVYDVDFFEDAMVDVEGAKAVIKVTGMPGKHVPPGVMGTLNDMVAAVPPTNGWMMELGYKDGDDFKCGYRIYISGDTLLVDELKEIPKRYAGENIDLMLIHLGGTTIPSPAVPLLMVTMDAEQGLGLVKLIDPDLTIPIHYEATMGLKAVHFGGGNIGRGFVAEKLHLAGYEVVFVDVMDSIIDQLQKTKEYTVTEIGAEGKKVNTITNYRAINSKIYEDDVIKEIASADLVTCAVGPNVLKFIAPVIGKGIDKRTEPKPIAVIACENAIGATDTLAGFIKDSKNTPQDRLSSINDRARFANSAIDRIVPGQKPDAGLNVEIESFYEWVVDKTPFAEHGHPDVSAIKWVDDLNPYIERKLFTVNTGHAAAAYYGYARGKKTVDEALSDSDINKLVHDCLAETSNLIVKKHGISTDEQKAYVEKIIKRISNPYLKDVVERVGRAPLRKLSRKERFVGPASQLAESGDKVDALLGAIEQAFGFVDVEGDEESAELSKILKSNGAKDVVAKVCGLEESHPLFDKILPIVEKVQKSVK